MRNVIIHRVLIVGFGSIGRRHLGIVRKLLPQADIRIMHHNKCNLVHELTNGCLTGINEATGFLPQIAVLANPAPFHLRIAKRLAEVGTHLLIEKPLSITLEGTYQLLKICKQNNVVLMTGYNLRFLLSLQHFKKLVKNKVMGNILSVRCEVGQYLPNWRPSFDYRQSVSARKEMGGGVLLELSHELDYLLWLFGDFRWVCASMSRQSELEIDVEDTVHIIFGISRINREKDLIGTVSMDFIRQDTSRVCTVICEKGSLRWNDMLGSVELYESDHSTWKEVFQNKHQRNDSYKEEWLHFLAIVKNNTQPLISGEDGIQVLHVIEAIRKSSLTGRKIQIDTAESQLLDLNL